MIYAILIAFGLCAGSFVNATVYRLKQLTNKKLTAQRRRELSITTGRSLCTDCGHRLVWYDLVPVLSWLALKGRCRYCKKPISVRYPVVEILTAAVFVLTYAYWPNDLSLAAGVYDISFWLILITGLMVLLIYDLKWFILPNKLVYFLLRLTAVYVLLGELLYRNVNFVAVMLGFLVGGGVFYALFQVSDGKWIGGGDVKLGAMLGLALGKPELSLLFIFTASLIGTIISLPLMFTKKVKLSSRIPFGPMLIVASILVKLFGSSTLDWYRRVFLVI